MRATEHKHYAAPIPLSAQVVRGGIVGSGLSDVCLNIPSFRLNESEIIQMVHFI